MSHCDSSSETAKTNFHSPSELGALVVKSAVSMSIGDFATCYKWALEASSKMSPDSEQRVHVLALLGTACVGMARHKEASDYYREAIPLLEQRGFTVKASQFRVALLELERLCQLRK